MSVAGGSDLVFLHGFQQGGLGFGRGTIDLISQNDIGKHRARHKAKLPAFIGFTKNLGAGNVRRHQVGCKLDTRKL